MANKNQKPNQSSYDYERTTTTTTTTSSDPTSAKGSGSRSNRSSSFKDKRSGNRNSFPSSRGSKARAWEIRPYSKSTALPNPGAAVNLNDERWYIGSRGDLADKYAAVPWTAIAGDAIPKEDIKFHITAAKPGDPDTVHYAAEMSREFQSIMVAGLIPALGSTNVAPIRLDLPWLTAAEQKLAYMQSKVSGSLGFHAADLVCYWFCAADIFAEIAAAERALKVARTWSVFENTSMPRCVCNALGWDYASIVGNSRVFEGMIKEVIEMANTLLLPKDLAFVERWYFLYSNILKDSNLPMAKLYAYRKDGYYTFEEALDDNGSAAQFHFAPSFNTAGPAEVNTWTPQTWFDTIRTSIMKLVPGRSTSVTDVMAKLIRAYDVSTFFEYKMSVEDKISPKFDPQALTAFANMSITGIPSRFSTHPEYFDVIQNVTYLTMGYRGALWDTGLCLPENALIRAWEGKPDTGTLFEITRLVNTFDVENLSTTQLQRIREHEAKYGVSILTDNATQYHWIYTNTELVTSVSVYSGDGMTEASRRPQFGTYNQIIYTTGLQMVIRALNWLHFEYAPVLYAFTGPDDETNPNMDAGIVGDIDNYTSISSQVLGRMHRFAITNLWGIATSYLG